MTLTKYSHAEKKPIEVIKILKKAMLCFIDVEENYKSWETVLITKLCLHKKKKNTH